MNSEKKSSQQLEIERAARETQKWDSRKARWNAWKAEQTKAQAEEMMLERSREER